MSLSNSYFEAMKNKYLPKINFAQLEEDIMKTEYEQEPIKGKFIVIEGIDGTGKSTQVELLVKNMNTHGIATCKRVEPTHTAIGKFIREEYLIDKTPIDPIALNFLFTADRADHITNPQYGLLQELGSGLNVVCDRYYLSTLAYNRHDDLLKAIDIQRTNMKLLTPDLTIFLDADPKVCMERISARGGEKEVFENLDKLIETRARYMTVIDTLTKLSKIELGAKSENIIIINASGSINQVHDAIHKVVFSYFKFKKEVK